MSKRAEQERKAKAYYDNNSICCSTSIVVETFLAGYEQAEKDLALTWKDVRNLCDCFMDVGLESNLPARSKEFYTEVLNRFNKSKEVK